MRKTVWLLASMAVVLVVAGGAAPAVVPDDGVAEGAALDRALEDLVAMPGGPPGVIAVVQRGQRREIHTFGVANLESGRRMRIDDRMRLASTAKAFSGAVALSLVSQGALSLDDTIGERLPDLPDAWSQVTLRQLLNHTSGLPDYTDDPDFVAAVVASFTQAPPPVELLSYVEDEPLRFAPGSEYRYSNSDNIVVGLMIEAATGGGPTRANSGSRSTGRSGCGGPPYRAAPTSGSLSSTATTTIPPSSRPKTSARLSQRAGLGPQVA